MRPGAMQFLLLFLLAAVSSAAAPTVTLVSPPNNAYVSGPTQFTVQVSDENPSGLNCTFYVEPNSITCLNPPCPQPANYSICTRSTQYFHTSGTFSTTVNIGPCTSLSPPYLWGASCYDAEGLFGYGGYRGLYYNSTPACTNECTSGQTQCNGTQVQTCGNYDADSCLEWSAPASCPSGQTCTGVVCAATPNTPPQIIYYYPVSGATFYPPGPDKFAIIVVDDRSTAMTCGVYYRPQNGSFSLLIEGQTANNTFTETRNSLLDSNPSYSHFTKNFTPGTYNYYFTCRDGDGLTGASPVAAGFGYYYTFAVSSSCTNACSSGQTRCNGTQLQSCVQNATGCWVWGTPQSCPAGQTCQGTTCQAAPCNCTNATCPAYIPNCGYRESWSCVNNTCRARTCGDGFCNWCGFSPCAYYESGSNCYQDCGCSNECTNGTSRCVTSYIQTCGNYDADPCTEWGPLQYCPAGQNCSNGACVILPGAGCTCTSYADCAAKLNSTSSCTTVTLANDLVGSDGAVALNVYGNKIFDGAGHTINGMGGCGHLNTSSGSIDIFGQNAKVRNLRMVDAVHLWVQGGGTGATIENVYMENTGSNSAILTDAPGVKIINTTIIDACGYGATSTYYGLNLTDVSIRGSAYGGISTSRGAVYACRTRSCDNAYSTDISASTLYGVVAADGISVSNPGSSNYVALPCSAGNLSSYPSCFATCTDQCSPTSTVGTQCYGNTIMQNCTLNATTGCYYWKNSTCGTNQVCITPSSCTVGQPCGACTNSYLNIKTHTPPAGSTPSLNPPVCNPLTGQCGQPYINIMFNATTNLARVECNAYIDDCLYWEGIGYVGCGVGTGGPNSAVCGIGITPNDLTNGSHSLYFRCRAPGGTGSIENTSIPTTFNVVWSNTTRNLPNSDCSCTQFYRLGQNSPANGATLLWTSNPVINYTVQAEACDYSTMDKMATFVIVDDCAYFDAGFFPSFGYGQFAGGPYGYEMYSMYLYSSLVNGPHTWKVELRGRPLDSCYAYDDVCMPILLDSTPARTFTVTGSNATQNNYGYCYYRTSSCTNECSSGQAQCNGTQVQTCGNYDADSCLEWGAAQNCSAGQTCSNGSCSAYYLSIEPVQPASGAAAQLTVTNVSCGVGCWTPVNYLYFGMIVRSNVDAVSCTWYADNCTLTSNGYGSGTFGSQVNMGIDRPESKLVNGTHTWYVGCNGSAGGTYVVYNSSPIRSFTVGWSNTTANLAAYGCAPPNLPPIVTLVSPQNGFSTDGSFVSFSYNVTDPESQTMGCGWSLWGTASNFSAFSVRYPVASGSTLQANQSGLQPGSYQWRASCTDSMGATGTSATYSLTVTSPVEDNCPHITNLAPANNSLTLSQSAQFSMRVTDPDEGDGYVDCALFADGAQKIAWSASSTTGTTMTEAIPLQQGPHHWNWTCADSTNCSSSSPTWILWVGSRGCFSNADCQSGCCNLQTGECTDSAACAASCDSDSDCLSGCCDFSAGRCFAGCAGCSNSSECPQGYQCVGGTCTDCRAGNGCNQRCAGDPDCTLCSMNADCQSACCNRNSGICVDAGVCGNATCGNSTDGICRSGCGMLSCMGANNSNCTIEDTDCCSQQTDALNCHTLNTQGNASRVVVLGASGAFVTVDVPFTHLSMASPTMEVLPAYIALMNPDPINMQMIFIPFTIESQYSYPLGVMLSNSTQPGRKDILISVISNLGGGSQ